MAERPPLDEPSPALRAVMEPADRRATPASAFERARDVVRSGRRLDMRTLARDVGVGRSTLYRWTGDRDQLLADVAWAELADVIEHLRTTTPGTGAAYLERAAAGLLDFLATNASLRAFLAHEGAAGLRLITAPSGSFRRRMVAAVADVIAEQSARGAYVPPDEPLVLADGILSLGERFLYHAGDPELMPDPDTAARVIALLLREQPRT